FSGIGPVPSCASTGKAKEAITPAMAAARAISLAKGCLIAACSLADQSPLVAARVLDSPSVSVPVSRRVGAAGSGEALEFGLVGMPSFSATWIAKSCGSVGWVLLVIGATICARLQRQEHVPSGGSRRGTCRRPAPPRCRFFRAPEPHCAASAGSWKNLVLLCFSAARVSCRSFPAPSPLARALLRGASRRACTLPH